MLFIISATGGKSFIAWLSSDFLAWVTSLLRLPVLILLYGLTLWMIVEIGMFTYEWIIRIRHRRSSASEGLELCLHEAAAALQVQGDGESRPQLKEISAILKRCTSHKFVLQFLNCLADIEDEDTRQFAVRLEKLLQGCNAAITKSVERTRTMVRIGPMLGLMGTLIPMGPALLALTQGDINTLASSLIYAFGTTVLGLLIGGIAYVITTVRQHWYDKDMNDIRYICEMLFGE
ncbi:MAG: MotA/TolQ/ExbB proton channel family protein [Methanophagales archaeon]|nr:MotA/TolQ/ExbB proton channel family protein [Methanophagales archaeon]